MSDLPHRIAAARAAFSAQPPGSIPRIAAPIVVDEAGMVWLEQGSAIVGRFMHAGVRVRWAPVPELGGLVLDQLGGLEASEGFEEEGILSFMTRRGLGALIADLQAIHDEMGDS